MAKGNGMSAAVAWIRKNAYGLTAGEADGPLDDLRPLASMVRDAEVVAVGTAARQTRELAVVAHRIVRLLVEEEGFRSVALEGDDPARVGLNAYVATGEGDPRAMLAESRPFWRLAEILDLVYWMRAYNLRHPRDPVRFLENPEPKVEDTPALRGLAGIEWTLAEGVTRWRERTGDRIVYWGGSAHTAVGDPRTVSPSSPPETHRNMGGYLRDRLGDGYRSIGLTLGRGSIGVPLPAPAAGTIDAVLDEAATGAPGYLLDLRAPRPPEVARLLDAPTRTRLIGPFYDPAEDEDHHLSGGALTSWFDAVVHVPRVTPAGPLPAPVG
ncbi:erythromycin esterase family protein [Nocardiopsis protaetiae]|uniref:erythromycin esterase family protein n=1 Tax=Nocardiopsis protaetiae TaxID=3382270 RepID=UPI00387AC5B1